MAPTKLLGARVKDENGNFEGCGIILNSPFGKRPCWPVDLRPCDKTYSVSDTILSSWCMPR